MQSTRKILIIFSVFVLLFSTLAFASDPEPEQAPLEVEDAPFYAPDMDLVQLKELASDIKAAAATTYTTDDIYNLLYAALRGSSSSTTYSLPYIANRLGLIYNILSSTSFGISKMYDKLNAIGLPFTDGRFDSYLTKSGSFLDLWVGTGARLSDTIVNIYDSLNFNVPNDSYSLAELTGMIWSYVQDISSDTDALYTIANSTSAVKSSVDNLLNITWDTSRFTYNGTSFTLGGSYLSSSTNGNEFYSSFTVDPGLNDQSSIIRIKLPVRYNSATNLTASGMQLVQMFSGSSDPSPIVVPEHYIEVGTNGTYLYLVNMRCPANTYHFKIASDQTLRFIGSFTGEGGFIPFDNLHYQLILTALQSQRTNDKLDTVIYNTGKLFDIDSDVQSLYDPLQDLADYLVSPEKQAAEDASDPVIEETLDGFTGNGSAAAKRSDSRAMKDVSGSLQNGLNSGGSVSGATGVFNSGSDFWGWFTQQNSNYINNPYPAPVVSPTRGSGDEIVDFLTPNSNELQDLLREGGDQR